MTDSPTLPVALGLESGDQLVALTGAGGKTTLMFALAEALPGRVLLTTTTRIAADQLARAPTHFFLEPSARDADSLRQPEPSAADLSELEARLADRRLCFVASRPSGDKILGIPMQLPARLLAGVEVDSVLVEADGARLQACKAPADHEPVVPPESNLVVVMAGLDSLEGPIVEVAHRPERVAGLTGRLTSDTLLPADLAGLLTHPQGGLQGVPSPARVAVFLNKAETPERLEHGRRTATLILRQPRVERVILGALASEQPVREVHQRVTAVVLAAGESRRMGRSKQLLAWGNTTVLGQTLSNLRRSSVHDVCVVTGHKEEAVARIAAAAGAWTVHNAGYKAGMLSSLQVALRRLPEDRAAVLVALADQPMVTAETIDCLLAAQRQQMATLVAPEYGGHRGNPVVIGRRHFAELLALPPGAAPRAILQRHTDELVLVPAENEAVLRDLDRPEDYDRWRPAPG